jgi:hypothetical protein
VVADHLSRLIVDFNEDVVPITKTFPDEQLMHISQISAPWFADIVNYLVTAQIPSHWTKQDRSKFLVEAKYFFGMIHTCLNTAQIRLYGDAFLRVNTRRSSLSAMIMHVEDTLVLKRPLRRFFKVDSIGLPFFVMLMLIVQPVRDVRS